MATGAEAVVWDLSDLDGVSLDREGVATLGSRVTGRVAAMPARELAGLLDDLERLSEASFRATAAAHLGHATAVHDEALAATAQRAQEHGAALMRVGLDLVRQWRAVDAARRRELAADPALGRHRGLLEMVGAGGDQLLTDAEERILSEKAITGVAAWQRLFGRLLDELSVRVEGHGSGRELSLEEALGLLEQPDRSLRQRAAVGISRALEPGLATRAFILDTVVVDRIVDDRLRYGEAESDGWLGRASLANGLPAEALRSLLDSVTAAYPICRRLYRVKARLMGCDRISFDSDRLAPVGAELDVIPWAAARTLVLEAYARFSSELAEAARQVFDRGWIDARPHADKLPHASTVAVPGGPAYILLSYTGSLRSLLTLAHEVGSAVHHQLAGPRRVFESHLPMVVNECVSLLSEQIVLHHAIEVESDRRRRAALLMTLLDSVANMVFRHVMMTTFELAVRDAREHDRELSSTVLSRLWMDAHRAMLGDDVELPEQFSSWWSFVPHLVGPPGHEHLHSVACLAAHSLHRRWVADELRASDIVAMLRTGGSAPPLELFRRVGLDLTDPSLWERELEALESVVLRSAEHVAER